MFIEKSLEYQRYLMAIVLRVLIAQQITTDYSHSYCNGGHTAILISCLIEIKMRGSESQSQKQNAHMYSGLQYHYSELFTWMETLNV